MARRRPNATRRMFREVTNWDQACGLAASLYPAASNCEGSPVECFIFGWTNAADMIEAGELDRDDNEEVLRILFHEVGNMYPELV